VAALSPNGVDRHLQRNPFTIDSMPPPAPSAIVEKAARSGSVVRFATFEVIFRRENCAKADQVKTDRPTVQVLAILLERPGDVVTRHAPANET